MKKKLLCSFVLLIVLIGVVGCGNKQSMTITTEQGNVIETEYKKFDMFSIKIPKEFEVMSEEVMEVKYPLLESSAVVYTNEDASINVAINLQGGALREEQIEEFIKAMEELYSAFGEVIDTNIYEKQGYKIGSIKMVSPALDTDIYNHEIVFSYDGKVQVISFNCTKKYQEEWEEVGDFIIESIKFKK